MSVLQVPADASPLARFAADALLATHIGGGVVGLISGFAAVAVRKGSTAHAWAGTIFVTAMVCMASVGAVVAPFLPHPSAINTVAGLFTLYLIGTAWMTVKRPAGTVGRFETGAAGLGAAVGVAAAAWVAWNWTRPHPMPPPEGVAPAIFAALMLLAVAADVGLIRAGGITGRARQARHLWRMLMALFVAAGSAAAQPRIIPPFAKHTMIPIIVMFAPLALLIFWMVRVRVVPPLMRALRGARPAMVGRAAS